MYLERRKKAIYYSKTSNTMSQVELLATFFLSGLQSNISPLCIEKRDDTKI